MSEPKLSPVYVVECGAPGSGLYVSRDWPNDRRSRSKPQVYMTRRGAYEMSCVHRLRTGRRTRVVTIDLTVRKPQ